MRTFAGRGTLLALFIAASLVPCGAAAAWRSAWRFGFEFSEIAIKGNHLADAGSLFRKLKYKVIATSSASGWEKLSEALDKVASDRNRVRKAVYFEHGWTHIIDPELVISTDEKLLAEESRRLRVTIVAWLSETVSDSRGFWVYKRGRLVRGVLTVEGKLEVKGRRLRAERHTDWTEADEREIIALVHRLGPGFNAYEGHPTFRVYDLDERP